VAGPIVHGDRGYRQIELGIAKIVAEFLPEADRPNIIFSGKDLYHGDGYFQREKWPQEIRHQILKRLAQIPNEFNLIVVAGFHWKKENRAAAETLVGMMHPDEEKHHKIEHLIDVFEHAAAFSRCELAAEKSLRQMPQDELAMIVAEDTDRIKKQVKWMHRFLRDGDRLSKSGSEFAKSPLLPLVRIVDTPHFASKEDSKLLQVADVCAFLTMRALNAKDTANCFLEIKGRLSWWSPDIKQILDVTSILAKAV
jgi:Protein of unknown function (DUF3800)